MFAQLGGAINSLFGGSKKRSVKRNSKSKNTRRSQKHRGGYSSCSKPEKKLMGGSKSSKSKSRSSRSSSRSRGGAVRSGSPFKY